MRNTSSTFGSPWRPALRSGAVVFALASAAGAQPLDAVGLRAHGARILVEEGAGHEGPGAADYFGFAVAAADFNGDGVGDLVAGLPGNDCDSVVWDCGATVLRLGVAGVGLSDATTRQVQSPGPGNPAFAEFGATLAAGDFNGDGRADLAVGMPGYHVDFDDEGAVQVHYGDTIGLTHGLELLREGQSGIPGGGVPQDRFGHALATGDFDADGFDDVAIGIPGDLAAKGTVTVAHGGSGGLFPFVGFVMQQGLQGLPDTPESGEEHGYALATGDFDGDGFDDLAIGVPSEDDVGAVLVVYGSPFSLLFAEHQYFSLFDLGNLHQAGSRFGETLAAGDFDADGFDDLVVGAPLYNGAAGLADTGQVTVVFGSADRLSMSRRVHLSESNLDGGTFEAGDRFGSTLATGDFDADGFADLAIGVPGHNYSVVPAVLDAGAIVVLSGRRLLVADAARFLAPGSFPRRMIPDAPQGAPAYGSALAAGDFDGNGFDDLAIGAPRREFTNFVPDAGGVAVLFAQLFFDGFETGDTDEWSGFAP
jgi:hypothetical protein